MVFIMRKFIMRRYGRLRIFHCKVRSLSISSLPNSAIHFHRGEILCNRWVINVNYKTTNDDILRRFLCTQAEPTQINLDAPNAEPIPGEVQVFQKYLKGELDVTKQNLDQTKNWAIEKDGYIKLRIEDINGSKIRFDLKKLTKSEQPRIENRFELSKFSTIEHKKIALRIVNQNGTHVTHSDEYPFQIQHVQNRECFYIISPNYLALPDPLNKLRVGQEVELRVITRGEKRYSRALEILNRPISWWMAQPGFETLLTALKLKPIGQMPIQNGDQIDKFFNIDQRRAIAAALDDKRPFMVIHGPRGSGKTLVGAEIINRLATVGKRVFISTYTIEYLRELLDGCKKRGLNEEKMIVLTIDPSIPRNIAQIMREHPKKIEMDKLSSKYDLLMEEFKWANFRKDVKKIEALRQEFVNHKAQIKELRDQIRKELFANVSVVFNPRENADEGDIINFRPDLQMIVNTKSYDKVNVWKTLSQAPRTIVIGNPSLSECVDRHDLENKIITQYLVDEFHGVEGVCFPLSTRYSTNAAIANCANHLIPYAYVDNIKIDEAGAHRRVIDCLSPINRENIDRIRIGLGFSPSLFEKLISAAMVYIDKDLTSFNSKAFNRGVSLHPPFPAAYDLFYNLGEALIMAKYASVLGQIGFPLDQIGFIVSRQLDAQPFVLRCLLKQKLNIADEMLEKFPIGNEFNFQETNWAPRDIIIRSGVEAVKQQVEKELAVPRLNFSLISASVQHFMIASEKEHIRFKMPENVIDQLRQIKERSLVISPEEIVSHSELKEANLFVRGQYKARIDETRKYIKNLKENESPLRDKRRAQRFSDEDNREEIFNLIDG